MKSLLLVVLFCCAFMHNLFAWQLRGTVKDADGEPLAYASVYIQNTTTGVLTNIKGEYFMELEAGSHRLVFSNLGYEPQIIEVLMDGNKVVDVVLQEKAVNMDTVVLTATRRDPAYAIMEKVVDNKRRYIHPFDTYIRETYLKASLEVEQEKPKRDSVDSDSSMVSLVPDTIANKRLGHKDGTSGGVRILRTGYKDGPPTELSKDKKPKPADYRRKLNFIESVSKTYHAAPNQFKSEILAYRDLSDKPKGGSNVTIGEDGVDISSYQTTTANPYLFYLDPTDAQFNLYENLITVLRLGDQPFVSPLSSTAWRLTYKYRLVESFMQDGRVIHRIEVTPRNSEGPVFEGEIFVVDGLWAIKSFNLQILRGALSYFRDFRMIHEYKMQNDLRWTLGREEYYYEVKDGKDHYYGNTIAIHKDYQLDVQHPRNFFRNELRKVEKEAFERDSTYWIQNRAVTLKQAELDFIRVQDSLKAVYTSPEYLREMDSTYNRITLFDVFLSGVGHRDRARGWEFFILPVTAQIQPWGVGGYRHMLGGTVTKTFKHFHELSLETEADYGFANQDVKGYGRLSFMYNPKRFARAYIKAGDRYALVTTTTNLIGLLGRNNYVRKTYFGLGHSFEVVNGLYWSFDLDFADRSPITGLNFDNDLFGAIDDPRQFDLYREFLFTTRLRWVPMQKYHSEPYRKVVVGSNLPTFELTYRKGLPGIFGSEINFDWVELRVSDEFRPGTFGVSRWAVVAGSYIQESNLRFNDFKFFRGSTPYLFSNPLLDFQNLDTTYSTTGEYFQANYVHDDAGAILNKVPLIRKTPLQLTGGASVLAVPERDLLHGEVFAGLTLPFRIKAQRFKAGIFYVTSYSNTGNSIAGQWKFGLTFFDNWQNRWNW